MNFYFCSHTDIKIWNLKEEVKLLSTRRRREEEANDCDDYNDDDDEAYKIKSNKNREITNQTFSADIKSRVREWLIYFLPIISPIDEIQ